MTVWSTAYTGRTREIVLPMSLLGDGAALKPGLATAWFGCAGGRVRIRQGASGDGIVLGLPLMEAGGLQGVKRLCLRMAEGNIRFGPYIGIMTTGLSRNHTDDRPFEGRSTYFPKLAEEAARRGAVAYLFSPRGVDWEQERVRGYVHRDRAWRLMELPLPDVVYNRLPNRTVEKEPAAIRTIYELEMRGIPQFNPQFFDKWQTTRWLQADAGSARYLPVTKLYRRGIDPIMPRGLSDVFIKPTSGSLGAGIVRVEKNSNGYLVSAGYGPATTHRVYRSDMAAQDYVNSCLRTTRNYIVQEAVEVARFRTLRFDVRVNLFRNEQGEWEVLAPVAKTARQGAITTHVHNGGIIHPLGTVLGEVFGERASEVRDELFHASLAIAHALDDQSGLTLGELGLDLGVTDSGQVWVFEANSRPGRLALNAPWHKKDNARSVENIIGFCRRLAGFVED
jgi:hypothetical protein